MYIVFDSGCCAYASDIFIEKTTNSNTDCNENADYIGESDNLIDAIRIANRYIFDTQKYIDIHYGGYDYDEYGTFDEFSDDCHKFFEFYNIDNKELEAIDNYFRN